MSFFQAKTILAKIKENKNEQLRIYMKVNIFNQENIKLTYTYILVDNQQATELLHHLNTHFHHESFEGNVYTHHQDKLIMYLFI